MIPSSRFSSAFLAARSTSALVAAFSHSGGLGPSERSGGASGSIASRRPRIGFPGDCPILIPPLRPGLVQDLGMSWLSLASKAEIEAWEEGSTSSSFSFRNSSSPTTALRRSSFLSLSGFPATHFPSIERMSKAR